MSGKKIELETSLPGDARPSDAALSARAYDNPAILPPFKSEPAPASDWVSESLLTLKVHGKLLTETHADGLAIHVSTTGTVITLTGQLKDPANLERAALVAKAVAGVSAVNNQLTLAPDGAEPDGFKATVAKGSREIQDALLEAMIKSRLIAKTGLSAFAIKVEANGGVVSISGDSPSRAHRDRVMLISRQTSGAGEVHDLMQIKPIAATH